MSLVPTAVFRTFESEDKSFQMAIQTMFLRLFGTIPGQSRMILETSKQIKTLQLIQSVTYSISNSPKGL